MLKGGRINDALVDMSGGVQETFKLRELGSFKSQFWTILLKNYKRESLMGCAIVEYKGFSEQKLANGLITGHAYTISKVIEIAGHKLIRLRNPWGNDEEWKGAWSDNSRDWFKLSESQKKEIGFKKGSDGEFWMSFEDFLKNWDELEMCHLTIESFSVEALKVTHYNDNLIWNCKSYHSRWIPGLSAGGCGTDPAKFWKNPQFYIKLNHVDENDKENKATTVISLMQKDYVPKHKKNREESINFKLFKVKDSVKIDEHKATGLKLYGMQLEQVASTGAYINSREVSGRFRVSPGNYVIIPSTFDQDHDCEFLLRVYTENRIETFHFQTEKSHLDEADKRLDLKEEERTKVNISINPIISDVFGKVVKSKRFKQINEFMGQAFNNVASEFLHAFPNDSTKEGIASRLGAGLSSAVDKLKKN